MYLQKCGDYIADDSMGCNSESEVNYTKDWFALW